MACRRRASISWPSRFESALIALKPVGKVAKAFSSSVSSLACCAMVSCLIGFLEIVGTDLFLGLPRSMIDVSDCSLRWPYVCWTRDAVCSDWFRKCPAGGHGGAEVGAAEKGKSHGFDSDRPAGAVFGVFWEDKLVLDFEVGMLEEVEAAPACGLGDFRPATIRADLGGTSGASSSFGGLLVAE